MKAEDELIVKIDDPIKLLKEIEAFFTFTNPPSEKDVRLIRASINYCVDKIESQPKPAVEQGESAEEIRNNHTRTWFSEDDDIDDPKTGFMPWPEVLKAMEEYAQLSPDKAIIAKMEEYIKLLGKELDETATMAHIYGWRSSRVEEGEKLRAELAALRTKNQ